GTRYCFSLVAIYRRSHTYFPEAAVSPAWLQPDDFGAGDALMKTIEVADAVAMIPDGASLMIGGFMSVGSPERVIDELVRQGKRNLPVIANDTAMPGKGIGKLVSAGSISRIVASHIGLNPETQKQMIDGRMEVDLVPQGTLVERIRAGGYG